MSYLIECNEWRLLQALGLLVDQRKSRFNFGLLDSTPEASSLPNLAAELFEVAVRHVFLPRDCSRALSTADFNGCEEKLKGVCELFDRIVHPRVSQAAEKNAGYPRLRSLLRMLEQSESDETFDLVHGSRPTLFKSPDDQAELKTSLALVTDYNDSLARLLASPSREAPARPVSKKQKKTWNDVKLRRRAASALGAIFEHLRCGPSHEVMLKVAGDGDGGAALSSLDLRLSSCPGLTQRPDAPWLEARCGSIDSYV